MFAFERTAGVNVVLRHVDSAMPLPRWDFAQLQRAALCAAHAVVGAVCQQQ
jgi:hypothetical protein